MSTTENAIKQVPLLSASRVLKYVGSLVVLRTIVKLGGFGEKLALTHYFELDTALDAFTAAVTVPMMFLFTMQAITGPTILPMFIRRLRSGDAKGAWSQWHTWLLVALLVLTTLAASCFVFADRVSRLLAPGFDVARHALCTQMLRVMIPVSVVMGMLPLFTLVLNAQRRFAYQPASELLMKVAMIGALLLFASGTGIGAAVWGTALGVVIALSVCVLGVFPTWELHGTSPSYKDPDFRLVLLLMFAPALGAVSSRVGNIAETAASSTLAPGSVAALSLAWKIVNMPLLIIPVASGTVLYTLFAEMNHSGQHESAGRILAVGVRVMLFIFLPLAGLTCVLSSPIIAFVYQRGAFDAEATVLVATTLLWLAPAMCALSIEAIVTRHFYSRLDVWPPVFVGIGGVALRVLLILLLVGRWQLPGLAMAIVVSRFAKVFVLLYLVGSRGGVALRHFKLGQIGRLAVASAFSTAAAWAIAYCAGPYFTSSTLSQGALLAFAGVCGCALYLASTYCLGNEECHFLVQQILKRMPKRNPCA